MRRRSPLLLSLAIAILPVATLSTALAQPISFPEDALPLAGALQAADDRTDVVNARLNLADAETALRRTEADPLALRLEKAQAGQRVGLNEAQLRQARYQAIADIASAYTRMLEAQLQQDLAQTASDVRNQVVDITRIRFERGSATALDVQDAQNDAQDALSNLRAATQGVALARSNLESLIGDEVTSTTFIPDDFLAPLPSLETVLLSLEGSPNLLQVSQGVELSEIGLDLLDPSYASAAQIDNAELQVEQSQESAREAKRGLGIQARSLYNSVTTAAQTYRNSQSVFASAQEREALEKQRLDAGLIADINFKQTQLATFQAFLGMIQAKNAYLNALFDLQAGTLTALEGLNEF